MTWLFLGKKQKKHNENECMLNFIREIHIKHYIFLN